MKITASASVSLLALSIMAAGILVPQASAQTGAPAPATQAGSASGYSGASVGNNSGGTAPGPVYPGPAAASGANSPPPNSGVTNPKTGANTDTLTNGRDLPAEHHLRSHKKQPLSNGTAPGTGE